jgi:hypothetical protein
MLFDLDIPGGLRMGETTQNLEQRVALLEHELTQLRQVVADLDNRLQAGASLKQKKVKERGADDGGTTKSEAILSWAGQAALLPRIATICFVMVLALALRTATENNLIDQQVGTLVGMLYAAVLIVNGWFLYRKESLQAPVLTLSGAFLMFSVVVETQAVFDSLPPIPAYLILMLTGGCLAYISHRFQKALPIIVGTLLMCLGGVVIDYPTPIFSYLTPLLIFANLLGFYATRLKRCSWLRWFVLVVTVFILQLWAFKLGIYLIKDLEPPEPLSLYWFFPIMIVFGCAFVASSYFGIISKERSSSFDYAVPTMSAFWTFWACHYVVARGSHGMAGLGIVSVAAAIAHYWICFGLANRQEKSAPGINTFALAGSVWLVSGLALWSEDVVFTLPFASLTAFGLSYMGYKWHSGATRVTSYLLQGYVLLAIVWSLHSQPSGFNYMATILACGAIALTALFHFYWLRRNPARENTIFFSRYDKKDLSAVLVLFSGLIAGFYQARSMLYEFLHILPGNQENTFICAQSILINAAVVVLMVFALRLKSRELRNVAILVTVIGAGKVFMIDLLSTSGIPLVLSVLSFGLVALTESFILARWQKFEKVAEPEATA